MALVSKYRFRLAGASLLQIMTDLRECRAAGDRRCGNQYSCREAPKPLDAHRRPCLRYRLRTETYLAAGSAETHARSPSFNRRLYLDCANVRNRADAVEKVGFEVVAVAEAGNWENMDDGGRLRLLRS